MAKGQFWKVCKLPGKALGEPLLWVGTAGCLHLSAEGRGTCSQAVRAGLSPPAVTLPLPLWFRAVQGRLCRLSWSQTLEYK